MSVQKSFLPHKEISPRWIHTLKLNQFRNYTELNLTFNEKPVVLYGENGSGKTNILEALSLFNPGRGLRRSKLSQMKTIHTSQRMPWAVNTDLNTEETFVRLSTGWLPETPDKRLIKIDSTPATQTALEAWVSILWIVPAMDRLFQEASSTRRKFFDRLVAAFDPMHSTRLYRYEHTMRERSRLLREGRHDRAWLAGLEETMACESVAIAASRAEYLQQLNTYLDQQVTSFPHAQVYLEGAVDALLKENPALYVEETVQKQLQQTRLRDAAQGGASIGCHTSDFKATHMEKQHTAEICSTGEQKALLIAIIIAHARWLAAVKKTTPLLLLDEVGAHLDDSRRASLFNEICAMKIQAWMTGTDRSLFDGLQERAQYFEIHASCVKKQ